MIGRQADDLARDTKPREPRNSLTMLQTGSTDVPYRLCYENRFLYIDCPLRSSSVCRSSYCWIHALISSQTFPLLSPLFYRHW